MRPRAWTRLFHQMFAPNTNPTASNPFEIVAYLQEAKGVRLEVRPTPGTSPRCESTG